MAQSTEKSNFNAPLSSSIGKDTGKSSEPKKVESKDAQSLSSLWNQVVNHSSATDKILNFILHPFVLLGGLIVTIYFLTRGKQENSISEQLREQNSAMLGEIKKLKKKNKKLKAQLDLLSGNDYGQLSYLPPRKAPSSLPPSNSKTQTLYLD